MKIDFSIKGEKELQGNIQHTGLQILLGAKKSLFDEATEIIEESKLEVPVDTGALQGSAYVEYTDDNSVEFGYGRSDAVGSSGVTPQNYMVAVHERLDVYHPNGKAKFLEDPVNRHKQSMENSLISKIRKFFRF